MQDYIKIDDIHKSFADNYVLRGISLDIQKGQSLVIIGRSGCGKSVLLKHINRLIEPDRGTIYFDGNDIAKLKGSDLVAVRKNIGMLFQSAALLDSLTVAENVGLGLKESFQYPHDKVAENVEEKLEMVGLSGKGEIYPANLSGGMRKRVGLARAIAASPAVLLYDEPTTGLDPITADKINELISDLHNKLNVTSIIVTHDISSAYKIGERFVMLHEGNIEFDGTQEEIKSTDNKIVDQFIHGRAEGPIDIT